ncbi:MAG: SPOR domain-containing protein [Candidatus Binatia bacterium]
MAENRRGKENRFYFSRGQMVLLGGVFILASVVIFFLGMFIGKSIEERKIAQKEEPLARIPVKPEAGAATQKRDEVTFNDGESKAPAAAVVRERPPAEKPPEKIAKAEAPTPQAEKKPEKVTAQTAAKTSDAAASSESADQGKIWRAQVNAFPDERSAKLLVDRLKNKGYNAYVSEVQNRGKTWYRVSVGRYNSRDEAEKIVEALKTKESHLKAFAASK